MASAQMGCNGSSFKFGTFSDTYEDQEDGITYLFKTLLVSRTFAFVTGAGDTPSYERVRSTIDSAVSPVKGFPWFPAVGNHDIEVPSDMRSWANTWAQGWDNSPESSRLAKQLPGIASFRRGPKAVLADGGGTKDVDPGTIYSFDCGDAHFAFINNYEQDPLVQNGDAKAGAWDVNGAGTNDATNSQIDWLRDDLSKTSKSIKFVFGHVAIKFPCYSDTGSGSCPKNDPTPWGYWSEHNSDFHTTELARVLSDAHVTAYYHGHDHVPGRMLVDGSRKSVYERLFHDVYADSRRPKGTPAEWEALDTPTTFWQIDASNVHSNGGVMVTTEVAKGQVTFEMHVFKWDFNASLYKMELWDTWTVKVP